MSHTFTAVAVFVMAAVETRLFDHLRKTLSQPERKKVIEILQIVMKGQNNIMDSVLQICACVCFLLSIRKSLLFSLPNSVAVKSEI